MWQAADGYERFMGQWSAMIAAQFLDELDVADGAAWLDIGCATGDLLRTIDATAAPSVLAGVDRSPAFIAVARKRLRDTQHATVRVGVAERLEFPDDSFDAVTMALVLNFVGPQRKAVREMLRVARPGGTVAGYVWDYDHPEFFLGRFFAAYERVVGERNPDDERGRWEVCTPDGLAALFAEVGREDVKVGEVEITMVWPDLDDLWESFTLGIGTTGSVLATLEPEVAENVRRSFEGDLTVEDDGSIQLTGRALTFALTAD